jgi:hypothetical protein
MLASDWFKCLYQFVTRFICSFLLDYWLCMESISLFITLLIVTVNLTEKLLPKPENVKADSTGLSLFDTILSSVDGSSQIQQEVIKLCKESTKFQAFVEVQVPDIMYLDEPLRP